MEVPQLHHHHVILSSSSGSTLYPFLVYVLANLGFAFVDLTGKPLAIHQYKIQRDKNIPVSQEEPNLNETHLISHILLPSLFPPLPLPFCHLLFPPSSLPSFFPFTPPFPSLFSSLPFPPFISLPFLPFTFPPSSPSFPPSSSCFPFPLPLLSLIPFSPSSLPFAFLCSPSHCFVSPPTSYTPPFPLLLCPSLTLGASGELGAVQEGFEEMCLEWPGGWDSVQHMHASHLPSYRDLWL